MCMDVKDFYLNNQMNREKYIMIQISMILQAFTREHASITQAFAEKYNPEEKEHTRYIYARVTK